MRLTQLRSCCQRGGGPHHAQASLPRGEGWVRAPNFDILTRVRFRKSRRSTRLRRRPVENSASNRKGSLGSTLGVCTSCSRLLDGNAAGATWHRVHGLTDKKLRSAQRFAKEAEELVAARPHTNERDRPGCVRLGFQSDLLLLGADRPVHLVRCSLHLCISLSWLTSPMQLRLPALHAGQVARCENKRTAAKQCRCSG